MSTTVQSQVEGPEQEPPRLRRLLAGVSGVIVLLGLLLGLGYRMIPIDRTVSQTFSAASDKYFAEPGVCVRLTAEGTLTAGASRSLGSLTRWRDIHVRDSTTTAKIYRASGPGACDLSADPVKAEGINLSTGWEAGRFHDYLNEDDGDFLGPFDLGSGSQFDGRSAMYQAGIDDVPVSYRDVRHGSSLCIDGRVWFEIFTQSPAAGSASDGGALDLRPCLTG